MCRVTLFELTLKQVIPNCSDEKKNWGNCPLWVSGPMPRRPKKHPTSLPVWKEINLSRSIGWGRKFPNLSINTRESGWIKKIVLHVRHAFCCIFFTWSAKRRRNFFIYNLPINFCGLTLDKTDHAIQSWLMVIRRYPPSSWTSIVWFYYFKCISKRFIRCMASAKLWITEACFISGKYVLIQ